MNIAYRIIVFAICLMLLSLDIAPVYDAISGTAIIAARTKDPIGLGHVGVAFQDPTTGKWTAGAIEGGSHPPHVSYDC
jgi:hypothetical protein